jgi:hypothetical protein
MLKVKLVLGQAGLQLVLQLLDQALRVLLQVLLIQVLLIQRLKLRIQKKSSEKGTKSNDSNVSDEDDEDKVSNQDTESYKSDVPNADNVDSDEDDKDDEDEVSEQRKESYMSDVPNADNVEDSIAQSRVSKSSSSDTEILDSNKNKTLLNQIHGQNPAILLPTKLHREAETRRNVPTQSLYYGIFTVHQRHDGPIKDFDYISIVKSALSGRRALISPKTSLNAVVASWTKKPCVTLSASHSLMLEDSVSEDGLSSQSMYTVDIDEKNYINSGMFHNELSIESDDLTSIYTC